MFSVRLRITSCIEYKGRGQSGAEKCSFFRVESAFYSSQHVFSTLPRWISIRKREKERERGEKLREKERYLDERFVCSDSDTKRKEREREREREEEEEEERDGLKADTRVGARARY